MNDKLTKKQRVILNRLLMNTTIGQAGNAGANLPEIMAIAKILRFEEVVVRDINHDSRVERRQELFKELCEQGVDIYTAAQDADKLEAEEEINIFTKGSRE
jgi:hypothetical protein